MGTRAGVWTGVLLAGMASVSGCFGEPESYFSGSTLPPVLEQVTLSDGGGAAYAVDLQGGVTVRLEGQNLNDPQVAVRVGDRNAEIVADQVDATGRYLTVRTPPGPIGGGTFDITVATSQGVATLPGAFEYLLPASEVFQDEAASLQVIGRSDGTAGARLGFWPSVRPRWAGSLFPEGALYYLPGLPDQPVLWQGVSPVALRSLEDTVAVVDTVRIEPVDQGDLSPLVLSVVDDSGTFAVCSNAGETTRSWRPGAAYDVTISGGVLSDPIEAVLTTPPDVADSNGAIEGLLLDDLGVAQVDDDRDLVLGFPPIEQPAARASFVVAEFVVTAPDEGLPDAPVEVARVVVWADGSSGQVVLTPDDLALLPPVDTSCSLAARALEAARLEDDTTGVLTWEAAYAAHDCMPGDSPTALYPLAGYVRLSRHDIYRISLPAGLAGCPAPGSCPGETAMVVDLVAAQEVPARFGPLSDCEDLVDNDQDGLIDGDDPGCEDGEDGSEIDDTGLFPCDNGVDDDGDGLVDYVRGEGGDPGCTSPSDPDETSSDYPCDDGRDNDGDGALDYRPDSPQGDPGCLSVEDGSEREAGIACDDGQDNDGDGGVDFVPDGSGDPGCDAPADSSEFGTTACDNGEDDDQDGFADYRVVVGTGDPGCEDPLDDDEKYRPPPLPAPNLYPCDDANDNDVDGFIDGQDPGCRDNPAREETYSPYNIDEKNPAAACDDGRDNDGDGFTDYRTDGNGDPECLSPLDNTEDKK